MTKLIALAVAGLFVAGTMFAGEHGDCAKQVGNKQGKMACEVSLASLNLTPEQKTKMDTVMAQHEKKGCTEASEAKYMREARGILTQEHDVKLEAEGKRNRCCCCRIESMRMMRQKDGKTFWLTLIEELAHRGGDSHIPVLAGPRPT